eukprot:TRINITY_DN1562_c0_g1_i1.p1 TRINITY_DN1562_c0_g1~~TRINITY_DN1562_c0_g1_i1.p1  ORF type:complete len:368 (-),score=80.24 TRINITY_DN1562_c0_g1_i1:1013-2116(-)
MMLRVLFCICILRPFPMKSASVGVFCLCLFIGLVLCDATYENPVIPRQNCPDPGVLAYYISGSSVEFVVGTTSGNDADRFPLHTSSDLVHWKEAGFIFPRNSTSAPQWASGDFWAPEIHAIGGRFVVYFVARHQASNQLGIGAAVGDAPTGPFKDIGAPIVLNENVGTIDPSYVFEKESGRHYLLFKQDGNGHVPKWPSIIFIQEVDSSGLSVIGPPIDLIHNDLPWEVDIVEAPWMILHDSMYYLFYSGNGFDNAGYSVGVARSMNVTGPFVKKGAPILHTRSSALKNERINDNEGAQWVGPGHCSVISLPNSPDHIWWMVYHAWAAGHMGGGNPRLMLLDEVKWSNDGWPYIEGSCPSQDPEPDP